MEKLIIFNCMLLLIIFIGLFLCKKFIRTEKSKNLTLFFSSVLTILCHYSTLIYLCITNGDSLEYLKQNPNLLLPIYPCNVVMWGCLIYEILKNKESTISIVAHATLLFNVLLIFVFGHIKVDLVKNMIHITISVVMMYLIGLYCNKIFEVLISVDEANSINSMFILHSPFPSLPFLIYPIIALCALILYFGLFSVCELFVYPKGNRWFNRFIKSSIS